LHGIRPLEKFIERPLGEYFGFLVFGIAAAGM
jgi:hypothetical protein